MFRSPLKIQIVFFIFYLDFCQILMYCIDIIAFLDIILPVFFFLFCHCNKTELSRHIFSEGTFKIAITTNIFKD